MQFPEDGNNQDRLTLSQAIVAVMRTRNMTPAQVAARMESGRNRATLYRILSGATQDPKVSTFVDICQALDVSPIEVLQLAAVVPRRPRDTDLLDIRLRQIFRRIQDLEGGYKGLAVSQLDAMVGTLEDHSGQGEQESEPTAEQSDESEQTEQEYVPEGV